MSWERGGGGLYNLHKTSRSSDCFSPNLPIRKLPYNKFHYILGSWLIHLSAWKVYIIYINFIYIYNKVDLSQHERLSVKMVWWCCMLMETSLFWRARAKMFRGMVMYLQFLFFLFKNFDLRKLCLERESWKREKHWFVILCSH